MAGLLGRLVAAQKEEQAAARGVELSCLARVLRAVGGRDDGPGPGRSTTAAVPGLAEQLTARELEVLLLLAAGTPNPRIAEELDGHPRHGQKARQSPAGASSAPPTAPRPSPGPSQLGMIP